MQMRTRFVQSEKYMVTVEVEMVIPEEDTSEWQTARTMISAGQTVLRFTQRSFWGGFSAVQARRALNS